MNPSPPPRLPASEWLRHRFTASARAEGEAYHRRGVVSITDGSHAGVVASVQGSRRYRVEVRQAADGLKVACTCPAFGDGPCKHIWAVVLAAEERGFLAPRPGGRIAGGAAGRPVAVAADDLDLDDDDAERLDPPLLDADSGPEFDLDFEEEEEEWVNARPGPGVPAADRSFEPREPWRDRLEAVAQVERWAAEAVDVPKGQIIYVVDVRASAPAGGLTIEVARRRQAKKGGWTAPMALRLGRGVISRLPDREDREALALLGGAQADAGYGSAYYGGHGSKIQYVLRDGLDGLLLPRLCATGRCLVRRDRASPLEELRWDEGDPWQLWLEVQDAGEHYVFAGQLRRGDETRPLAEASLVGDRLVILGGRAARFDHSGSFVLATDLRRHGELRVPRAQGARAVEHLLRRRERLRLDLPEEMRFEEVRPALTPRLAIKPPADRRTDRLACALSFNYHGTLAPETDPHWCIPRLAERQLVVRDREAERAAAERLGVLGFRRIGASPRGPGSLELAPRHLPSAVPALLAEGWRVEAEGKLYRPAGSVRMEVVSGIDWFDLKGVVEFEDAAVALPAVLAALRRGATTIALGDGTVGILPEEWLKRYGLMASLGTPEKEALRFRRSQAGLLDALLASQPGVALDEGFTRARDALREFEGVRPAEQPKGFAGVLREYQRQGLGWLGFLERFGFGGCLADDMGLGKTVQVLALFESRRTSREPGAHPSLVVVPRSLVFNWKEEAARFAPGLRILDHTSPGRARDARAFAGFDIVLTTYGTLRRDLLWLKDVEFDYVVLDEAQAVKNAATESAKAVRLLRARRRLALSGTPIENHIGELWSLFDFLNPGWLGRASVFATGGNGLDQTHRGVLARALRPFILRRTKAEVAPDLPPKVEQTVHCELDAPQRKLYDELRRHYRGTLLARIDKEGIGRSQVHVLEALLRLRQAACHPGLIDPKRAAEASAKLDALLPRLEEVHEEGHKTLVFSQFTSFLAILRARLEARGLEYAYLDGRTRDRAARVRRFQEDPSCALFLISLKAGGLGLNLTAAEYVFLLDPWWNPAVEAQAIDRTHRIGQGRHVFAYRLIARDTVEEKVIELQARKRDLADALLGADKSLIGDLRREDLELLLS